ncbi:MAG: family metallopeptidase [Thermoleophilia bacterium]|nr:family metallopeptidase [Thermoleophilia bacterium]
MRRHRTIFLETLVALLLAGLAAATLTTPAASGLEQGVPRLVFPLVAKTELWDNYGDPRGNGRHAGIDMENAWRAPVVAVEDGRVEYAESGLGGCMLYLYGRSGTMYLYIHLNNDLTARNDNKGGCVKDVTFAVPDGGRVSAGEQVAWNGDSGDANGNPHLHFEVHPNGGADVSPFKHLKRASRQLFAAKSGSTFSLGLRGKLVAAGAGSIKLEVERVRQYPGGRWLEIEPRPVELSVPPEAAVAASIGQVTSPALRAFRTPVPVAAYTVRAKTTADAIIGSAGTLQLSRVAPLP